MNFNEQYAAYLADIEQALPVYFPAQLESAYGQVTAAARYSLLAGGKRIRPVLLLAAAGLLDVARDLALPYAAALEMIHTYSLVHDDLPCMDDDDLRRGRPTCHKVYGEGMAVLAGDALLNRAYEVILEAIAGFPASRMPAAAQAGQIIARAAGSQGMIGGQALDLAAESQILTAEALRHLHALKTGQLLLAPVLAAAALAGNPQPQTDDLRDYATHIGLAFQIQDDILDVTADQQLLGKTTGKDVRDAKSTYVTHFGLAQARQLLAVAMDEAGQALARLGEQGLKVDFLQGLTGFLLTRQH